MQAVAVLVLTAQLGPDAAQGEAMMSPEEALAERLQTPMLTRTEGTITGEGVCWHAAVNAGRFTRMARQTDDPAWVEAGLVYFDALSGKLHTSPDGYRGWVGPYIYDESVWGDVHVGDAILVNPMLDLATYVLLEAPAAIRTQFGERVRPYIALGEHICAKWDARGTWLEDGHLGGYVSWSWFISPDSPSRLQQRPEVRNAALSLPFNKQQDMGIIHLRLFHLTGDEAHRRQAQLIFSYTKSRLSLHEDYYTWNYWEPLYPGDVTRAGDPPLEHWVNTHPYRDYQSREVEQMVEAFHSGVVFTAEDMGRLVRTNLRMWNGDLADPQWVNSDVAVNGVAVPGWEPPTPDGGHFTRRAGALWRSLTEFDQTLAQLAGTEASNTACKRHHPDRVTEFVWPTASVTYLQLGCALPASPARGHEVQLVSKCRVPGQVRIVLVDGQGGEELAPIYAGPTPGGLDGIEGILVRPWRADVEAGPYRVRWIYEDEHRDYSIRVR